MNFDMKATTEAEISRLIVDTLHLELSPNEIVPDARLFGEGLGLDSIDALELALALSRAYGIELKSDDPDIKDIFSSLRSLASYVDRHRGR